MVLEIDNGVVTEGSTIDGDLILAIEIDDQRIQLITFDGFTETTSGYYTQTENEALDVQYYKETIDVVLVASDGNNGDTGTYAYGGYEDGGAGGKGIGVNCTLDLSQFNSLEFEVSSNREGYSWGQTGEPNGGEGGGSVALLGDGSLLIEAGGEVAVERVVVVGVTHHKTMVVTVEVRVVLVVLVVSGIIAAMTEMMVNILSIPPLLQSRPRSQPAIRKCL